MRQPAIGATGQSGVGVAVGSTVSVGMGVSNGDAVRFGVLVLLAEAAILVDWITSPFFHHVDSGPTPVPGYMKVGTYTGDGTALQSIAGVGFEPDYVIVVPPGAGDPAGTPVWVSSTLPADTSFDFDATQYVPSETREFIERYGEDNDFRSHKFYRHPDRDQYQREKFRMMSEIPLPHVWRSKVWGPRGATVIQGWHVAYLLEPPVPGRPLRIREEWTGYQTLTL